MKMVMIFFFFFLAFPEIGFRLLIPIIINYSILTDILLKNNLKREIPVPQVAGICSFAENEI